MVELTYHGGDCCGLRHLHGFGREEERAPVQSILDALDDEDYVWGRGIEVVLTDGQCASYPNLLTTLANMGFVLTSRERNHNSGNNINIFLRIDDRLDMEDLPFNWPGMVIRSDLHGRLPNRFRDVAHHNTRHDAAPLPPVPAPVVAPAPVPAPAPAPAP